MSDFDNPYEPKTDPALLKAGEDLAVNPVLTTGSISAHQLAMNPVKFSVSDLEFTDQNGFKQSLRDIYGRFAFVERKELERMNSAAIAAPSTMTPVSLAEYTMLKNEFSTLKSTYDMEKYNTQQILQILQTMQDKIKQLEQDLADRPQTTPTW